LINAIQFARRERARMGEMVERTYEYAQRTFSIETMARQTLEVYARVR
jgi:glycosyltransferase involved in cell wall biosynthesis